MTAGQTGFQGTVVVPVYNELARLQQVVDALTAVLPRDCLLFVEDGSTDESAALLAASGVPFVRHPLNLGYAEALRTGMTYALRRSARFVVFFDGDGQHRVEDLLQLVAVWTGGGVDLVLGSRYTQRVAGGSLRRLGTRLFSWLASRAVGSPLTDVTCGLKLISREWLPQALALPAEDLHAEWVAGLVRQGARVCEVPIEVRPREAGVSMYHFWKAALYPLRTLLCLVAVLLQPQGRSAPHESA